MGDRAAQRFTQLGSENWGDKDNSNKRMQMLTVNSAQYVRNFIMQHSETAGRVTDLLGVFTQLSVWDWDDNNLLGSHSWRHHNTLQPRIAAVNQSLHKELDRQKIQVHRNGLHPKVTAVN